MVRLNPAVRIFPPSDVTGDQWLAENLLERRRYKLSTAAAAALVASCRPQEPGHLAQQLAGRDRAGRDGAGRSTDDWAALVDSLIERSLIVDDTVAGRDPRIAWLVNLRRSWSRFGWHEAAEYHALSFDYPCVDYSEATAILTDRARMRGYQSEEPDTDRFKLDYLGHPEVPLPAPGPQLSDGTARTVWSGNPKQGTVDLENLSTILSLSFGATGFQVPRTQSAPLLRRTSPSGGGRHPSEGYVIVRHVSGIEAGWYHVTMQPFGLRKLEGLPLEDRALEPIFAETIRRCPLDVRAIVVVTSVFERNMYRYREPRTFRTVHMDAGHIAGTLRIAARSAGLSAAIYTCDDARGIEQALGIDGMKEGYMLTVAIADGSSELPVHAGPMEHR